MMNKSYVFISAPAVFGVLLVLVVLIDLSLFEAGSIDVKTMLNREVPIAILGFLSVLVGSILCIRWLLQKAWSKAAKTVLSVLIFLICFVVAGVNGGVFLNAT